MEMTTVKTIAVFTVILGCFAVLYPKIFHPLILSTLGISPSKSHNEDVLNKLPPHLRKPNMGQARPVNPGGGDMRHQMRGGPHPGMRAAAEMQKQANQGGGGGGKGMMTMVLPMYAIGIVVYLVYTLSKIFGNKKNVKDTKSREERMKQLNKGLSEVRYDADRKKFMYGEEDSEGENNEFHSFRQNRRQQRDLEKLLYKADKEKISDLEMRELKRRLMETEAQMTRILSAMETVTEKVQGHPGEGQGQEEEEHEGEYMEKENYIPVRKSKVRPHRKDDLRETNIRRRNVKPGVKKRMTRTEALHGKVNKTNKRDKPVTKDMMNEYYEENDVATAQDKAFSEGLKAEENGVYTDDFDEESENSEQERYQHQNYVEDIGTQNVDKSNVVGENSNEDESISEEIELSDSQESDAYDDGSDINGDDMQQESQFSKQSTQYSAMNGNQPEDGDYYDDDDGDWYDEEEEEIIGDHVTGDESDQEHTENIDLRKRVVKNTSNQED